MTKKATDIIAYISVIGWLVAFFAGTRKESKFHLNQALTCAAAGVALSILDYILPWSAILTLILWVLRIVLFVLTLVGFIAACKGEEKPVPVLGGLHILKDELYETNSGSNTQPPVV